MNNIIHMASDSLKATRISQAEADTMREHCARPGSIVTYGHYWQDKTRADGKKAIEWIVLNYDSTARKALLLSKYGLDAHRFDEGDKYQGWKNSEIRRWLNSTFLKAAFTAAEQKAIVTTKVSTPKLAFTTPERRKIATAKAPRHEGLSSGGPDTAEDKIWLLSWEEAREYFKSDEDRNTIPTVYAAAHGAYQSCGDDSKGQMNGTGCCFWWLRSSGLHRVFASFVSGRGFLSDIYIRVNLTCGAVRPAFWLDLDSAEFSDTERPC